MNTTLYVKSTLAISKSNGLSEILQDIRTLIYRVCRNEEKINQTTTFNKWICELIPEVRDIFKILLKRDENAPLLLSIIFCHLLLDFYVKTGTRFSLRGKPLFEPLFEISKVEVMRVNCILSLWGTCIPFGKILALIFFLQIFLY